MADMSRIKQLEWENEKLMDIKRPDLTPIDFKLLGEEFTPQELEWKIQRCGTAKDNKPWAQIVPYINSRAIMQRLDDHVGPERWKDEYQVLADGIICTLSLHTSIEWVSKSDGAQFSEIEGFKGGISNALKRAAVKWGIGRYLYDFPQTWAECSWDQNQGKGFVNYSKIVDKVSKTEKVFYWKTPN